MRRAVWIVCILALLGHGLALAAETSPAQATGTLVVLPPIAEPHATAALRAANEEGGARWQLEWLSAPEPETLLPIDDPSAVLRNAYLEADFLRCLEEAGDVSRRVASLVAAGHAEFAGRLGLTAAACAAGAGDRSRATHLAGDALARGLVTPALLASLPPDVQGLAEEERVRIQSTGTVAVRVTTLPPGARLRVDAGQAGCTATPCTVGLVHGSHTFVVEALGHETVVQEHVVAGEGDVAITLPQATPDHARAALARALGSGRAPSHRQMTDLAARAFGTRLVVFAWNDGPETRAILYDEASHRVRARASVRAGTEAVQVAVRSVVAEWHGAREPTPILEEPLFWGAVGLVAVAAGVATYFVVRPTEVTHVLVFE